MPFSDIIRNEYSFTVSVVAKDMRFALEPSQASAGTITFVATNDDPMPHDFAIEVNGVEHKTTILDPGKTESFSETNFVDPGNYTWSAHSLDNYYLVDDHGSRAFEITLGPGDMYGSGPCR
jgi:hypothetical protein